MNSLTHLDDNGRARMVDVSAKVPTTRQALVQCRVHVSPEAFAAIHTHTLAKGDACTVAKLAGIQAAKRTAELIPLCHPLPIEHLDIQFEPEPDTHTIPPPVSAAKGSPRQSAGQPSAVETGGGTIRVMASATTTAKTGIEMEAFVAVTVAALALYDMVKAMDPAASITDIQLISKTGGKKPFSRLSQLGPLACSTGSTGTTGLTGSTE